MQVAAHLDADMRIAGNAANLLATQHTQLEGALSDFLALYCAAFRADPKDTFALETRFSSFQLAGGDDEALWREFQRTTCLSDDQTLAIADSTRCYLEALKVRNQHGSLTMLEC